MTVRYLCLAALLCLSLARPQVKDGARFRETFRGGVMSPQWSRHLSAGAEIVLREGIAEIRAPMNAYAHLSRPPGMDRVTVSARLLPSRPAGISWCASVFLVWRGGDWCQMGMIAPPNGGEGRYYAVETLKGRTSETYLDPCDLSQWHSVRIELGRDVVRYGASEDGKTWRTLRVIARPAELAGPPAALVVGRGYGRGEPPYAGPELDNDYADRGPMVTAQVADIRAEPTPPARQAMTAAERAQIGRADMDPVALAELRGMADPTYAGVARHYPAMRFPREVVGVPEHPEDMGVDGQGRLQFGSDTASAQLPTARFETGDPPRPLLAAPLRRRLVGGCLPIVTLSGQRSGLACEQTVFGWSEGFRPDSDLFAFIRLKLRALPGGALPAGVQLALMPGGQRLPVTLTPLRAREAVACLRVPFRHPEQAAVIPPFEFETTLAETEGFWQRLLARGMRIETPDARINNAYRAWLAYSLLDVDRINGYAEPHDGAGFYELIYGYSAAFYCLALDQYGLHDRAARYLDTLLHFQQPDGLYTQNFGLPDHGALLIALAEHDRLTGDAAWRHRVAGAVSRACNWIVRQRQSAPKTGVARGLIKFRAYCDYPEPVYGFFGDTNCCVGLERAADLLAREGAREEAALYRREAARYRADILRSMEAASLQRQGMTLLPMEPVTLRLLRDGNYRAGEYYGLVASCVLDSDFLPAGDPRAFRITDFLERRGGLLAGVSRFGPGGIDHAYAGGYLQTLLKRGEARRYLLGFYGMLAYGMTRDTYSGVEVTTAVSGENQQTLPHLYSCTQQLRTLRGLLLREEGESLLLGEAIPRAWLADGKKLTVAGAPTRFGTLSFTLISRAKTGRIEVRLQPPARNAPARLRLRLRHPGGRAIRAVQVNGRRWTRFSGEVITLDGVRKPARLLVSY